MDGPLAVGEGGRLTAPRPGLEPADERQLLAVVQLVRRILGPAAGSIALFGSAVDGGLRPDSDLDLLVIAHRRLTAAERRELLLGLLPLSGSQAAAGPSRSIELSVVVEGDLRPWRYPPPMELQYGDWWRREYEAGREPWSDPDPDLAVLLTTAMDASAIPLHGPPPAELLDQVPLSDLRRASRDLVPGLDLDLATDTRNVLLTYARVWLTLATGLIRPKDVAADWAIERLPTDLGSVLAWARDAYRDGGSHVPPDALEPLVGPLVGRIRSELAGI